MADFSADDVPVAERLVELAVRGALVSHRRTTKAGLLFAGYALVSGGLALATPNLLLSALLFAMTVAFVVGAMMAALARSFGRPQALGPVLRARQLVLVTHFPERRGIKEVLLLCHPRQRWQVRLPATEGRELLELLSQDSPALPVWPHDPARFRRWVRETKPRPEPWHVG